jgi:hypothetical protein
LVAELAMVWVRAAETTVSSAVVTVFLRVSVPPVVTSRLDDRADSFDHAVLRHDHFDGVGGQEVGLGM